MSTAHLWPFILSGGLGSRLWPLSRRASPKQFHALIGETSLLAASLERLRLLGSHVRAPSVICHASHADLALAALDETGFTDGCVLLEPEGRNTAAAAVLACLWAADADKDALVALMPADHHIARPQALIDALIAAMPTAASGAMVVFGVRPERPDTCYGYIERGAAKECGFAVARFVEKPDVHTARLYVESGRYDWNAGIFLVHARHFLAQMDVLRPDIVEPVRRAVAATQRQGRLGVVPSDPWLDTPEQSLDYAYAEHATSGVVVPVDIGWSDVGSWTALHALADKDEHGNAISGHAHLIGANSCYVRSGGAGSRTVAVVGLNDVIVVDTPDALLIARRGGPGENMRILGRALAKDGSDLL